jgi:hypothetical protein
VREAIEHSDSADQLAQNALDSISHILLELPGQVEQARKLPRDVEESNKEVAQVCCFIHCYSVLDHVERKVPKYKNHKLRER